MVQKRRDGNRTGAAKRGEELIEGKQRIFPVHFAPGKKLFHIIVKLSDAPGSYSSILEVLSSRVNLIGTQTYTLSDGTAVFSGFAEALSKDETSERLRQVILASKSAFAAKVVEGVDGLLVDNFHTGYKVGNDNYMLMRRQGLGHMFDAVTRMLGTGGDVLLYAEGLALGQRNAEIMIKNIGIERVRTHRILLNRFLAAQGWGVLNAKEGLHRNEFTIAVNDCFECSESHDSRKGCNFIRGYLAGGATASLGAEIESVETKCMLRGAEACEFRLRPRA